MACKQLCFLRFARCFPSRGRASKIGLDRPCEIQTSAGHIRSARGVRKAGPQILEPVMRVEVVTPEDFLGTVLGDLNSRRGQVEGMEGRGNAQVVKAFVPLANMFGYTTELRSATQGRATSSMEFAFYQPLPDHLAQEIIVKRRG